jgi:hypothetical protein
MLWGAFEAAHRCAPFDFPMEIAMEYRGRAVETALSRNMEHDTLRFELSRACREGPSWNPISSPRARRCELFAFQRPQCAVVCRARDWT